MLSTSIIIVIALFIIAYLLYLYFQSHLTLQRQTQEIDKQCKELEHRKHELFRLTQELTETKEREHEYYVQYKLIEQEKAIITQALQESKEQQATINQILEERFRSITTQILDERADILHKRSEASLNPLREDLKRFGEQVQNAYNNESRERHSLQTEIRLLVEQSNRLSVDANNLTQALKGGNKVQGNWGEMILEDLLTTSGLEAGKHFYQQAQYDDEEAHEKLIPDVVVHFPNGGRLVIDSKVNLKDYMEYVNAPNEEMREHYAKKHLEAVRTQIRLLHSKHYSRVVEGTPDFVLLFIPNEPAYLLAMQQAPTLWSEAYDKKILIMNTTNLMATLKMAEELWRREQQHLNMEEVFKKVGDLYDQFHTYVDRLEQTARQLEKAQEMLSDTRKSLSTGRGNVLRRFEEIKKMGAKTKKELKQIVDKSTILTLDEEDEPQENSL